MSAVILFMGLTPMNAPLAPQEKDIVRMKREAKAKGGFYCEPEAKLLFVIRIKGLNKIHPKVCSDAAARGGGRRACKLGRSVPGRRPS